ncbi:4-hydroxy-tetrahydrodipicolinate reductase [Aureivirga marina]|uniref:4-hydroxy-tetrahydrodipicolinate reductase n=1 Tax=Aureivirga marina TaxID=1182451 RepID=UPI0018CA3172|nr:4-hydroxy-tetrahydrodipicolinate reductase [Aureivirga marina]
MKIALLGYGRMGKVIERIALERGHDIVLKIGRNSENADLSIADIAIDFSIPSAAFDNISMAINAGIPVISGTTGWLERYDEIIELCEAKNGAFIYGSNFSLGVNIFFELNEHLAKMMKTLSQYHVSMEEIHHMKKLDAPSGTAISLAEGILKHTEKTTWELNNQSTNDTIPIYAKRIPNVPGTHAISYVSDVDTIEIKHTAHSREGFALGAVIAAEWLVDKKGVYTMKDVLGI